MDTATLIPARPFAGAWGSSALHIEVPTSNGRVTPRWHDDDGPKREVGPQSNVKTSEVVLVRSFSNSTLSPLSRAIAAYRRLDLTGPHCERTPQVLHRRALHLTSSQLTSLAVRYQAGATVYELAHQFYIDRRTVAIHLKRQGVTLRLQSPPAGVIDDMVQLYESGLSLAGVGKKVGVDAGTVQRHLSQRGVVRRDSHGRPRHQ